MIVRDGDEWRPRCFTYQFEDNEFYDLGCRRCKFREDCEFFMNERRAKCSDEGW